MVALPSVHQTHARQSTPWVTLVHGVRITTSVSTNVRHPDVVLLLDVLTLWSSSVILGNELLRPAFRVYGHRLDGWC